MDYHILDKYFQDLSDQQMAQFASLGSLYTDWNSKINVISRKDIEELYLRHVLHSLGIAKVEPFVAGQHILDVGTGGGFPGIPLAIMFPETTFHLVDSIQKKIKVVNEVANSIGLKNLKAEQQRAEKLKGEYNFIVSRAVTQMPKFLNWVKNKTKREKQKGQVLENGILYLKGGDLREELASIAHKEYLLSNYFSEDFFETKKVIYIQY